jgi:hypothetical protein
MPVTWDVDILVLAGQPLIGGGVSGHGAEGEQLEQDDAGERHQIGMLGEIISEW